MDEFDTRLRVRLAALADAVPVSAAPEGTTRLSWPTTRRRPSGFSALAIAAGVVLIVILVVAMAGRGASLPGASSVPPPSSSPAPTGTASTVPPTLPTRPPADLALPYPDGCAAYGLSPRRCAYIVDWALTQAGVTADAATVQLLGDPACVGQDPGCMAAVRTTTFVVRVRVTPTGGEPSDHPVFCGLGGETSMLCTDTPLINLGSPMSGYHDVPCGAEPAPGKCASPVPTIAPSAAADAVPLRVPRLTIAIDHAGAYTIDIGDAVLPNGILTEAAATLANDRRTDVLIPQGIQLEVVGEDAQPLVNAYDQGWRPGTEQVHVRLVFTVESFDPGATLEITDVLVR